MTRKIAALPFLFLFACSSGPEEVDASLFDAGNLEKDTGVEGRDAAPPEEDMGIGDTGTGTTATDAGLADGEIGDGEIGDGEIEDGEIGDGDLDGGGPDDAELSDVDLGDGQIGDTAPGDSGQAQLSEDFTDPENEIFTCPDTTMVLPALAVENGTQCLGIDGSGCPDDRGLPGPGSVECADPAQNPFTGGGQCVADFFACFDATGTCTDDGAGTFTWGSGAVQTIQVDAQGRLVSSEFTPSTGGTPCIVGLPETAGGTRVIYTQQ